MSTKNERNEEKSLDQKRVESNSPTQVPSIWYSWWLKS